mmetsp:Transcript_95564/g.272772  ORF Transcript_95564/g.272772 Transcript_95564/m.272772 type:complete len:95 (+) Transcript_95564:71-355(+)
MDHSSSSTRSNSEELPRQLLSYPGAHGGDFEVFVGKEDFKVNSDDVPFLDESSSPTAVHPRPPPPRRSSTPPTLSRSRGTASGCMGTTIWSRCG